MSSQLDDLRGIPTDKLAQILSALMKDPQIAKTVSSLVTSLSQESNATSRPTKEQQETKKKKKQDKAFDMTKYRRHHVAMEFQYEGGPYFGFASQAPGDCEETIEKHIFEALLKCRLIENRQESGYSRCGRTDRGVSALGQVVAFNIRSSLPKEVRVDNIPRHICDLYFAQPGDDGEKQDVVGVAEMDYCGMLNRCLPENIRCTGWAPVSLEFSARFSCASRTYRYFFTRKTLDVEAMGRAAALLVGEHDFRHICKMDMANVTNFRREIYEAKINLLSASAGEVPGHEVWMLEIRGIAFLWHMVRCIMAVLLLVGEGKEQPEVVTALLDVERLPGKPQYSMAAEEPLVLHRCSFDALTIQRSPKTLYELTQHFERIWDTAAVAASRARNALEFLKTCSVREADVLAFGSDKNKRRGIKKGTTGGEEVELAEEAAEEGVSRKRVKIEAGQPPCLTWAQGLALLQDKFDVPYPNPSTSTTDGYVPLLQRKLSETYSERKEHLGGSRRERLDRHVQMQQEERDLTFFERMRAQGNVVS